MSDGLGRGGTNSRRPPPRRAEDQDSTVVLRSTRGTGLPPRILSSGRGRGVSRGGGLRSWPAVRPQSGSVPPWAHRAKTMDTFASGHSSMSDGGRVEASSGYMSRKEPPTQPKWDRERSRTPIPPTRMTSSSPPSASRPNAGASTGYSAGPSHQRWMAPEDQAGPSRYSVPESQQEREPIMTSGASSSSTSRSQSQSDPNAPNATSAVLKSSRFDTELRPDKPGQLSRAESQSKVLLETSTDMIQDEKEDMQLETPGAGPSRTPEAAKEAFGSPGRDVKPDLSALEGEEKVPSIADEDRQDGVLAVKRSLVLQCYEKNVAIRTAARKAFRVQKTAELSAVGRIIQHVLWRDDGVGVQWIKARNRGSLKKPTTVPTNSTSSTPINIEHSPPRRPASPQSIQSPRPPTPPSARPTVPDRTKTPPIVVEPELPSVPTPIPFQPPQHTLPTEPSPNLLTPEVQSKSSIAAPGSAKPAVVQVGSPALSDKQKGKRPAEETLDNTKRKPADDSPELDSSKPAKLPKVDSTAAHQLSSEDWYALSKSEKKILARKIEAERKELIALHGKDGVDFKPKKQKKSASERKKIRRREEERLKEEEDRNKLSAPHQVTEGIINSATEAISTAVKASNVPQTCKSSSATTPDNIGKHGEKSTANSAIKSSGASKRVIDLSNDTTISGPAKTDISKGKNKGNPREIVDLTQDSSNDLPNPTPARSSAKATTSSTIVSRPATIPARTTVSSSTSRPGVPLEPTAKPSAVRPPVPPTSVRPTAPVRPSVRPPTPAPVRPPGSNALPIRPSLTNGPATRPSLNSTTIRLPPGIAGTRPPPSASSTARPPPSAVGRPPLSKTITHRIPSDSSDITRPTAQPQYQAPMGQSSYSERQALAALARPPVGQPVRPVGSKFMPRPAPTIQARPIAPNGLPGSRPPGSADASQARSLHPGSTLSSSSPLGGPEMLPSRSTVPAVTTPRYKELRRLLSEKMEEMDNWTSMLVDLPDRAEMTQRQIDRTRQECFVLQKQMRDEKDKVGS